jgi:hypothetical protein
MTATDDGMSLRDVCESVGPDAEPMECAFLIAAFLRTAVQGEPSTFEGECASLVKASERYDIDNGADIRRWLDNLGPAAELKMPTVWWAKMVESADADEQNGPAVGNGGRGEGRA